MNKKILVAEDDESILEVVKVILENEGYTILSADNELAVHTLVEDHKPDLILLDIWLTGADGGNLAKQLKIKPKTSHIPIIIMSAHNQTEKISKESGADDFLLKPFDIDDLLRVIKKYIPSKLL